MADDKVDWMDNHSDWPVSVDELRLLEECSDRTVRNWASNHGIRRMGRQYIFFKKDVLSFRQRERPGRRW